MPTHLIQTTKGLISIGADTFESAQDTAVNILGYELVQGRFSEPVGKINLLESTKTLKIVDEFGQKIKVETGQIEDSPVTECNLCDKSATAKLNYYGRMIPYCTEHYEFESRKVNQAAMRVASEENPLHFKIEQVIKKTVDHTVEKASELYNTERPNWIVSNFNSPQEMRDSLIQFITSIENLVFEKKNKLRAAYDAARELDASLSKSERDALINDPAFKAPENKEYKKKIQKGTKDEKAIASLLALGMSEEQAKSIVASKK